VASAAAEHRLVKMAERMVVRMAAFPVSNLKYVHKVMDFYMYI
jgi:hypothetical protein